MGCNVTNSQGYGVALMNRQQEIRTLLRYFTINAGAEAWNPDIKVCNQAQPCLRSEIRRDWAHLKLHAHDQQHYF